MMHSILAVLLIQTGLTICAPPSWFPDYDPSCPVGNHEKIDGCPYLCGGQLQTSSANLCGSGEVCCPSLCGGTYCFSPVTGHAVLQRAFVSDKCPKNKPRFNCEHLCNQVCTTYPTASCRVTSCGGCTARYYLYGIFDVTDRCNR